MTLDHGEVQDFTQGAHLTNITARIDAAGDTLRITRLTANATPGTIAVTGSIGALAPGPARRSAHHRAPCAAHWQATCSPRLSMPT